MMLTIKIDITSQISIEYNQRPSSSRRQGSPTAAYNFGVVFFPIWLTQFAKA